MKYKIITTLIGIMMLITGMIIGHVTTDTTPDIPQVPWYCQSVDNLKQFQKDNPTLGVIC